MTLVAILAAAGIGGCTEFVHFGQISDRESSRAVHGVVFEQHQPDGGWRVIGESDGKGKYNIFKDKIKGGGKIRLTKPGYRTIIVPESEFLQQHNILMAPTGEVDDDFRDL